MPLTLANPSEPLTIRHIGGTPEVRKHLANLGFVVGSVIHVVNRMGDNVIVNVKETRVAISEEMAKRIMV